MNRNLRILIVEDEAVNREILKDSLTPYGQCDFAENGKVAVHAFVKAMEAEKPYHLICMDIMMPEINGQQALKAIRQIEKKMALPENQWVKVIMISSLKDNSSILEALYDGEASKYLIKPIDQGKLIEYLKQLQLIHGESKNSENS